MRALCYKCGYDWNYKGNQRGKDHLSCPKCSYKLVANKVLLEDDPSIQVKLHSSPLELHKKPLKIHTYIHKKEKFIEIEDGIFVEKKIAKQFKEAPEEIPLLVQEQEQEPVIRILPPKFEIIRIIPRDPIKILEHQRSFF